MTSHCFSSFHIFVFFFVCSVTGDGLTLLEMAVIQGNQQLLRLLQTHGATENQYRTYFSCYCVVYCRNKYIKRSLPAFLAIFL